MKFLIDAQLPPALCGWLEPRGQQARHVMNLDLLAAPDRTIADVAERDGWTIVSKDDDFLILRLPDRFALLWLRVGNTTNRALVAWLEPRWAAIVRMLETGERLVEVR